MLRPFARRLKSRKIVGTKKKAIVRLPGPMGRPDSPDEHVDYALELAESAFEYCGRKYASYTIRDVTEWVNDRFRTGYHFSTISRWIKASNLVRQKVQPRMSDRKLHRILSRAGR